MDHNNSLKTPHLLQQSRAQELCESRGGRPGLQSLISLMVSVDVKQHFNVSTNSAKLWEVWRGYMGAGVSMKERGEHSDTYT